MHHAKILVLMGPNLNMLGRRDPVHYGVQALEDIQHSIHNYGAKHGQEIDVRQSNYEGELVTWIQEALDQFDAIIINAAAYTHTSIAIHDALALHDIPIIEVHHSKPKQREAFRHVSYIEPLADKVISGEQGNGYLTALDYLAETMG